MAITKIIWDMYGGASVKETFFEGRVLKVEKRSENRNWSGTMDCSDYRITDCIYALVWLGTNNLPPRFFGRSNEPSIESSLLQSKISSYMVDKIRDLEFFEQFAWVDCTNIFSDRNGFRLTCEVDAEITKGGDPLMWANFIAWEAYRKALVEKETAAAEAREFERQRLEAEKVKKKAVRTAKVEAKDAADKVVAESNLSLLPAKGSTVTVEGFTGTLFWKGVTKYRGKWAARCGIRNAAGEVVWSDSTKFGV